MSHPTTGQLEATVFRWLPEAEARQIRAHAANCPTCAKALGDQEAIQRRLGLLRAESVPIDVVGRVMAQLGTPAPRKAIPRLARLGVVLAALVAASLLIACTGKLRQTMRRLRVIVAPLVA